MMMRRSIIIGGLSAFFVRNHALAETAGILTVDFGDPEPHDFPLQYPASLGLWHGWFIDALVMNGATYGSHGGDETPENTLIGNDYWASFDVWNTTGEITYLRFVSHQNRVVEGGSDHPHDGKTPTKHPTFSGVRILRIGGHYEYRLNHIQIEYIDGYQASHAIGGDIEVVLDFIGGEVTIHEFSDEKIRTLDSYKRMSQLTTNVKWNSSAEGEYYVKFRVETDLEVNSISRVDIEHTAEKTLETSRTVETHIAKGETAVLVGLMQIMQDSDGNYWTYPTGPANWVRTDNFNRFDGYFDFTAGFSAQSGLHHTQKYGMKVLNKRLG